MSEPYTKEDIEVLLLQKGSTLKAMVLTIESNLKEHKQPWKLQQVSDDKYIVVDTSDSTDAWLERFITRDPDMIKLKEDVKKLAAAKEDIDQIFSVLITGETGTGKELIARALHGERDGKFVAINCAGLPSELVESELFGYMPGAFTSASQKGREGLIKAASKGTLFMDEIGELPLQAQAKLLRTLQSKSIRKVGGEKDEQIDCRIVCATHRNLQTMTAMNEFRNDLYARISTFELHIAPLKNRTEDIIPIIESLPGGLDFLAALKNKNILMDSEMYPYNVRSLQKMVKQYKILGKIPS